MNKVADDVRAYLAETGRKGGKAGTGDAKRRGAEARWKQERAKRRAQADLFQVAREIGEFLDEIHFPTDADDPHDKWERRRKRLADLLYKAVAAVKKRAP